MDSESSSSGLNKGFPSCKRVIACSSRHNQLVKWLIDWQKEMERRMVALRLYSIARTCRFSSELLIIVLRSVIS